MTPEEKMKFAMQMSQQMAGAQNIQPESEEVQAAIEEAVIHIALKREKNMATKTLEYAGDKITVRYEVKRCIHAEECVHGLPAVFDPQGRPWVQPNGATVDEVAEIVMRCPTGALHFERKDGGAIESVPDENVIRVSPNGPLYVHGDLQITAPDGNVILQDTRVALCRCGASKNKPFCDNTHLQIAFQDTAMTPPASPEEITMNEKQLRITPTSNGSLRFDGVLEIHNAANEIIFYGEEAYLCRCGGSKNKPFCDGSHSKIGFRDAV
jgi:CDGSH-type Zn-finger protein/uncharacterized Fe-S cluster protein YjdI